MVQENPQIQNQEEQISLFQQIPEDRSLVVIEKMFTKLPKVFIEGNSLVKISLVRNFVNCSEYKSRSGATFEGCFSYENGELKKVRGIYYAPHPPVISLKSRRKMAYNIEEMKDVIKDQFEFTNHRIKSIMESDKWLVKFDNWHIMIYDKVVKGKILKFQLMDQQGNLYISMPPKIPTPLPFERVKEITIYNHTIRFQREVIRFKNIFAFGGVAELVYNDNNEYVYMEIVSDGHEDISREIKPKGLILFTHPKPNESID